MRKRKLNPAEERIWGDEPMGINPLNLQCQNCLCQFVTPGEFFNKDWMKYYCLVFSDSDGKGKPYEISHNKEACPYKVTIKDLVKIAHKKK